MLDERAAQQEVRVQCAAARAAACLESKPALLCAAAMRWWLAGTAHTNVTYHPILEAVLAKAAVAADMLRLKQHASTSRRCLPLSEYVQQLNTSACTSLCKPAGGCLHANVACVPS